MWHVDTDHFPRSLYVLRDENGETLKTETAPGWYRTSSRAKAERDCARLNRKEKTMKAKTAEIETAVKWLGYCPSCERNVETVGADGIPDQSLRLCAECGSYTDDKFEETQQAPTAAAEPLTKVAFRFWFDGPGDRKNGEVTAIMPEILGTADPYTCTCYAHMGQHGACNMSIVNQCSRPATAEETARLLAELESLGYRVEIIKRLNQQAYLDARRAELARMRA